MTLEEIEPYFGLDCDVSVANEAGPGGVTYPGRIERADATHIRVTPRPAIAGGHGAPFAGRVAIANIRSIVPS